MPSTGRIQDIERLRAIAALGVLIGHVPWVQVGLSRLLHVPIDPWTGVDLFFVISGFVVSSAFERDLAHVGESPLKTFYRKRAARILPTAYIGLALWWVGVTWLNQSGAWGHALSGGAAAGMLASGALLVSNYAQVFAGVTMPLFWFWSICIEEHFYLLYPAFRLSVGAASRRAVGLAVGIVAVHGVRLVVDDPELLAGLSHMRFDQLALGVLMALLVRGARKDVDAVAVVLRRPGAPRMLAILTMLLLLTLLGALPATLLRDPSAPEARLGYALAGVLSAAIVMLAGVNAELLSFPRSRMGGVLSYLGGRSYGIYMFHVPALWLVVELRHRLFADPRASWLQIPEVITYFIVLGLIVQANYRWVERPLIAWAARDRTAATVG